MIPTEPTCDAARIDDYLDDRLNEAARRDFEQHLNTCTSCRDQLQQRAAAPEVWQCAFELLGGSDSSTQSAAQSAAAQRRYRVLNVLDSLTPSDDPEMLGRLGEYEISGVIGVGGMGSVLKGFDKSLRRVVAIKVMAPHLADSGSARTRFHREARAAAAIAHVNVIDTYGVSEANGLPYLVMPFARGPSLQKRIDESGPLTALEVVRIGRQIASGLAAAHEQGLVHRDIKPANILLNEGIERLWITDFGVARAIDDASMTQTGVIAGTPQYMSPEQARGETVDPRSDLFSMGSVLYTACTGHPPFRSEAAYGILRRITDTDPRPIRELNPEIPDWLCRFIERLMAKHPGDRFQSAKDVADLLERCLAHLQQPTRIELPQCVALPADSTTSMTTSRSATGASLRQASDGNPPPDSGDTTTRRFSRYKRVGIGSLGIAVAFIGLGFAAHQLTEPVDISGHWAGEKWSSVSLTSVKEASHWYTGSFTDSAGRSGAIHLEWSRLQRRYNGRWKLGGDQTGAITLRIRDGKVSGAISFDSESPSTPDSPRLRDFVWERTTSESRQISGPVPGVSPSPRPLLIQSPVDGRIVRWGDGIAENSRVTEGSLIVEVELTESDRSQAEQSREAQQLVQTTQRELQAAQNIMDALESQLKAYEQVRSQLVAAADLALKNTQSKLDAETAELTASKAALKEAQLHYEQQQELFDQQLISELKLQTAERMLRQAEAASQQSAARVADSQQRLTSQRSEHEAKASKAQADIEYAKAGLLKAQADAAKAQSAVAAAQLELAKVGPFDADRIRRLRITATSDGIVTGLTLKQYVDRGDTLCTLWPSQQQPTADAVPVVSDNTVKPQQPAETSEQYSTDKHFAFPAFPGMDGRFTTRAFVPAAELGRRFRELRPRLQQASADLTTLQSQQRDTQQLLVEKQKELAKAGDSRSADVSQLEQDVLRLRTERGHQQSQANELTNSISSIKRDLTQAERERTTNIAIIQTQLGAKQTLYEGQTKLTQAIKARVQQGAHSPQDLPKAELAEVTTAAEIRELELLLEYYENLSNPKFTTAESERDMILGLLTLQIETAKSQHQVQSEQTKAAQRLFELGDNTFDELLAKQQAELNTATEIQRLQAILEYFTELDPDMPQADAVAGPPRESNSQVVRPRNESERTTILALLSAQLEAAEARLQQAQQDYDRQKLLHGNGLVSAAKLEQANVAVAEAQAEVKTLKIRTEYYRSEPAED